MLGSTENTLGRSRIVEALKQQWPDHELQVFDGDRKRDRDRKMRAYFQGETDEWKPQMHLNETATESAWNANESRGAWEQASPDEAGSWEDEEAQLEGSFAEEDEEEPLNLAGTQLNDTLASERNTRRTVAQARELIKSSCGVYCLPRCKQEKLRGKKREK